MSFNEPRDVIFENCYKWTGYVKERSYYSMKRLKNKIAVACTQINRKNTWSS